MKLVCHRHTNLKFKNPFSCYCLVIPPGYSIPIATQTGKDSHGPSFNLYLARESLLKTLIQDVLRYAGLAAWDAAGRELLALFEAAGDDLRVLIDDTQVAYPIRVDPWVKSATLTASDGAASDKLGDSIAMTGAAVFTKAPGKQVSGKAGQGTMYVVQPVKFKQYLPRMVK